MEIPSVVLFAWAYFYIGVGWSHVTLVLLCFWELHYIQRTFVYPALFRSGVTAMPLSIVAMGFIFNLINAPLNAIGLTYLPVGYLGGWFTDPRFFIGIGIFLLGFAVNLNSDHILRNLRKPTETGYKVPQGGLFRWVASPNYLGEIVEWVGWMIASWSLAGAAFAAFTFANLAPRAWAHHKWYLANFADYPKNRKALIPWVF
jgi:protein-S-isoprenylcysteine O-methyltransferase Ste14